jgi:hypothetical protein
LRDLPIVSPFSSSCPLLTLSISISLSLSLHIPPLFSSLNPFQPFVSTPISRSFPSSIFHPKTLTFFLGLNHTPFLFFLSFSNTQKN